MKTAKYLFLIPAIVMLIIMNTAWATEKPTMSSDEIMDLTDLNQDDRLDIEEYHRRITEVYFFLDADKDGKLTVVEIQKGMAGIDTDAIKKADVDGDTIITIYEFHYVLDEDFEIADKDQDGTLDRQELEGMVE